ncbi:MAG TPA: hypothetical protein VE732_05260 [Nitrososphaera sp.]|jgi:hypothetical protein|nr:hypothetical protein [Nitrososphaera sp.]
MGYAITEKQDERIDDLKWELDSTAVARDKALYYLLVFCEAAEREQWPVSNEIKPFFEHASNLLFEHNIFTNLPEPDAAILHLMEIVAVDLEQDQGSNMNAEEREIVK